MISCETLEQPGSWRGVVLAVIILTCFGPTLPLFVAAYGDIYFGLWYPIVVAIMTVIVGALFLHESKDVDIMTGSVVDDRKAAATN